MSDDELGPRAAADQIWIARDRPAEDHRPGGGPHPAQGWPHEAGNGVTAPADIHIDPSAPFDIAQTFMGLNHSVGDTPTLHHHRGEFFEWKGSAYRVVSNDNLRARLYPFLATAVRATSDGAQIKPNMRLVANVLDGLRAATYLEDEVTPPAWLCGELAVDPDDIIACRNGLLHWPSRELSPHTPKLFNINAVDFDYRADAPLPDQWLAFLNQLWPDDASSIQTLQEIFGLSLVGDTSHQKVFLLVGPRRSGKATIARVLTKMVGVANVAAPTLHSLGTEFGLQPLINKKLAIIGDARIGPKTDTAAVVERLLSISGEDLQTLTARMLRSGSANSACGSSSSPTNCPAWPTPVARWPVGLSSSR